MFSETLTVKCKLLNKTFVYKRELKLLNFGRYNILMYITVEGTEMVTKIEQFWHL